MVGPVFSIGIVWGARMMEAIFRHLDPLGESLALTTSGNIKNLVLGALELRGILDLEAVRAAILSVAKDFPHLKMRLKEVKQGGRHYLVWDHQSQPAVPLAIWDVDNTDCSGSNLETLLKYIEPDLERARNLFEDSTCVVHLLRLSHDHFMLAFVSSHVAADAMTVMEVAKEFMIHYHERVTGQKLASSGFPVAASTVRKRAIRRRKTVWKDYWLTFRQAMIPYKVRCALPHGSGDPKNCGEHHVKRLLSQEESERVAAESMKRKVSLVDYLLGSMATAIDRWNRARNIETATVTAGLTVNMQGRFQELEGPNSDSVLYFVLNPKQRDDPDKLARMILLSRIRQFRDQMDWKYYRSIAKLNSFFRILPFRSRQKAFLAILGRHQTSFALGFMGALWPPANERKITGESSLTSAGGLTITEVHGTPYKLVSQTPLYLSAYFFRKRLNLVLTAAERLFTADEAQSFLDLIVETLLPRAGGISG